VDAQLPPALARWLVEAGHDAWHVEEVGLREAEDQPIWRHALEKQAVIITKDEDFAEHARRSARSPVIVWLRVGNASNRALLLWFAPHFPQIIAWIGEGHRLIEVR
jgi:predicted nuclease of predicted toxin-antitoxin system